MRSSLTLPAARFVILGLLGTLCVLSARDAASLPYLVQVDTTADNPAATVCSEAADDCSLRGALILANTTPGYQLVRVPAGTYALTIAGDGEDNAATGDLDIRDDVTIEGAGSATTIIDANALDRVFDVYNDLESVRFSGLSLNDGVGGGAAIQVFSSAVDIYDVAMLAGNASTDGGGALSANGGTVTISHSRIIKNSAAAGGGIYAIGGSTIDIHYSTIDANTAASGGGIYIGQANTKVTITQSTIANNTTSAQGGGIYRDNAASGDLRVENSTISSNNSGIGASGSAVWDESPDASLFSFVTIADNTGDAGTSAILHNNGAAPIFLASLLVYNVPDNCSSPAESVGYNTTHDGTCGFSAAGDQNVGGGALVNFLSDNGGPTRTHFLQDLSPAIDTVPIDKCSGFAEDQRGRLRPVGGACDSGAYEAGIPAQTFFAFGDLLCAGGAGLDDFVPLLNEVAGVQWSQPQSAGCPELRSAVAIDTNFPINYWGDLDCDGTLTALDTLYLLLFVAADPLPTPADCPTVGQAYNIGH